MWMCAPASNPTLPQAGILAGSLADMREEAHTTTPALPHTTGAQRTTCQQAHLRACPNCKLSHNPTSQQESMHT
jgi:hypothetical protein